METRIYTEDDVERIRRFLVRELVVAQTVANKVIKGTTQASRDVRIQTIADIIEIVNDLFEVYTLDSIDY